MDLSLCDLCARSVPEFQKEYLRVTSGCLKPLKRRTILCRGARKVMARKARKGRKAGFIAWHAYSTDPTTAIPATSFA